jgi:hypothetical protein
MRLSKRDVVATVSVAAAGVLYALWVAGMAPWGQDVWATGVAVLALGFIASAVAVVPGFDQLLHGSRVYLVVTSALGLVALAGGVAALVASSELGLGLLVVATGVLWLIATIHHGVLASAARDTSEPGVARARADHGVRRDH